MRHGRLGLSAQRVPMLSRQHLSHHPFGWFVEKEVLSTARPGYDRPVLNAMRRKITARMRRFWDDGIRGPDFIWAATGPGLEAYSQHPVVLREATASGGKEAMPASEFLREVRHLVVILLSVACCTATMAIARVAAWTT